MSGFGFGFGLGLGLGLGFGFASSPNPNPHLERLADARVVALSLLGERQPREDGLLQLAHLQLLPRLS